MKKLLLLILCLALIFPGSLMGCGKTSEVKQQDSSVEKSNTEANKKEELTIMVVQLATVENYSTNEYTKWAEEQTNIHVNWQTIPEQGAREKMNIILAGGEYPDAFLGCGIDSNQEVQFGANEKVFIPLNDLIKKYGTNLNKALDELPGSRGLITNPDGNIYSLPLLSDCFHCNYSKKMWINSSWLKKLNLAVPTTTEEFYQILKAFKKKDPNGNGKQDEIPLAGATKGWNDTIDAFIMNAFIYSDMNSDIDAPIDGFFMNGSKVDTIVNKPEYKEGLKYLNKLYKEGLIYDGSFVQDSAQLKQLVENKDVELVGAVPGGYGGMFSQVGEERYRNFDGLAPLKGPNGVQGAWTNPYGAVTTGNFVITKDCKKPEVAMKWADLAYSFEATMRSRRGLPDVSWRMAKAGEIGINGLPALWTEIKPWQTTEPQNESYIGGHIFYESDALRLGQTMSPDTDIHSVEGLEKLLYEVTKEYAKYKKPELQFPPVKFLVDEQTELAAVKSELAKYIKQSLVKFIVGEMDLEKDWDKYLDNINKLGMDKVLAQNQKAYDRQFKK